MFFKLALALTLRLHDPTFELEQYTLPEWEAENSYTVQDWEQQESAVAYTTKDFARDLSARTCKCIVIKIWPSGQATQRTQACHCHE